MPKKKTKASSLQKVPIKIKKNLKSNRKFLNKIVGFFLIVFALILLIFRFPTAPPIEEQKEKGPIVIDSKLTESKPSDSIPVRVIIPSSDIDLTVKPSKIVNGFWELSENTASYGLGSGTPGTKSNTVIFAHAREGLFYNLKDVTVKDTVYVFTKDKWHRYEVKSVTEVFPNDVKVIQPTDSETITLYTCSGFNDKKRLIVTAVPQK